MKSYFFLINMLLSVIAMAQYDPNPDSYYTVDMDRISEEVLNKESNYSFDSLYKRFASGEKLNIGEYFYLYYGSSLAKRQTKSVPKEFFQKVVNHIKAKENTLAAELLKSGLSENPFSIRMHHMLSYVLMNGKNEKSYIDQEYRYKMFVQTVINSNDGVTPKTPMVLLDKNDYVIILRFLEFKPQGALETVLDNTFRVELQDNDSNLKYLYFKTL